MGRNHLRKPAHHRRNLFAVVLRGRLIAFSIIAISIRAGAFIHGKRQMKVNRRPFWVKVNRRTFYWALNHQYGNYWREFEPPAIHILSDDEEFEVYYQLRQGSKGRCILDIRKGFAEIPAQVQTPCYVPVPVWDDEKPTHSSTTVAAWLGGLLALCRPEGKPSSRRQTPRNRQSGLTVGCWPQQSSR